MTKHTSYLLILFLYLLSSTIFGNIPSVENFSVRQHALGNVKVAIDSPKRALFTNPASLSFIQEKSSKVKNKSTDEVDSNQLEDLSKPTEVKKRSVNHFTFLKFNSALQESIVDSLDSLKSLQDEKSTPAKIQLIRDLIPITNQLRSNIDVFMWTRKNFGLGIYTNNLFSFETRRKSSPEILINFHQDLVIAGAYSKIFNGTAIGITPKFVKRYHLYDKKNTSNTRSFELTQDELIDLTNNDNNNRLEDLKFYAPQGFLLDFGVLRELNTDFGKGTWGATLNNVGPELSGELSGTSETIKTKVPVTATFGASINTNTDNIFLKDTTLLGDIDVISEVTDFKKRLHFGLERELFKNYQNFIARSIFIRGGLNQGFIVGGFGIKLLNFKKLSLIHLDYSFFTEEIGEKVGTNTASYHTIQFSLLL